MWIHIIIPIVILTHKIIYEVLGKRGKKRGGGVFRNGGFKRKMATAGCI